jgi:uncharacterized protein YkwD
MHANRTSRHVRDASRSGQGFVVCLLVALALAACGGGDSSSPAGTSGNGTTIPPAATGSSAPTCGLNNFQTDLLAQVNARRAAGATCGARGMFASTGPLQWNALLTNAAAAHSQDMASKDFFSHTGSDGSSASQRIAAAGYAWQVAAENIAAGYSTVQAVMDGWMASEGHCANIMNAALRDIGVACVPGNGTTYSTYWSMDLGAPQ